MKKATKEKLQNEIEEMVEDQIFYLEEKGFSPTYKGYEITDDEIIALKKIAVEFDVEYEKAFDLYKDELFEKLK